MKAIHKFLAEVVISIAVFALFIGFIFLISTYVVGLIGSGQSILFALVISAMIWVLLELFNLVSKTDCDGFDSVPDELSEEDERISLLWKKSEK